MADENSGSSSDSSSSGGFGGGSDPNATGGGSFGGGSYSPGQGTSGQYSMAGTMGTLNTPTVNTGNASVSVFGGTPAGPQFGSGLGAANISGLSFNPSALGAPPSSFGPNSGALDSSQFSQADPNKPSTGLSPVSLGSGFLSPGLLGAPGNNASAMVGPGDNSISAGLPPAQLANSFVPSGITSMADAMRQQSLGMNAGSPNGVMFNPGELNNNDASVPGSIGNSIPDASRFVPMAPVGPSPSQARNVLSWSQEPASTQNAQAASFMPPGLGYASLNSSSAPSSPNDPFGGTSLSPLNAGYSILATPQERDMAIRTIASEADPSTQGYAAVAGVIANRAALNGQPDPLTGMPYPGTIGGVVSQRAQFSGYNDKNYHAIDPNSDQYQHIGSVFDNVLSGNIPDPTNGATYYYAPKLMSAPYWSKGMPPGQTIGTQVFFGGTPSQQASQAASVQPNNTPSSPYGGLYNPAPPLASVNSMPAGLGYSGYAGTPTSGNAINIGPGGPQAGQQSLGTIASPWGTGTSEDAMNFAMARGPAGLAANMITPPNNNVLSWTAVPPTHSSIPQGDASSAAQYSPIRNPDGTGVYPRGGIDAQVPLSADAPRPNPALAAYDNGMLFNPNYGENNSGVLGQWGVPGSIQSQDQSVYSPESPMFNRPYVAAYSPSLLGALPPTSTAPVSPTGVSPPAEATIASPAERPALTVPSKPITARSQEKSAATSYDLHPVDYNPFPNSPTNLQGSAFLDAPTGQVGKAFNYLAGHGGTYSPSGGSTGKSYSPATPPIIPPTTDNGTAASAVAPAQQGWSKDGNGIWNFGPMPAGYVSPFPASTPASQGFAGGGGVSFVSNNDPMADPEESAKDDAYVPDAASPPPAPDVSSYNLHPVPYDPFQAQPPSQPTETPESFLTWQRQRQAARDFEPTQVSAVNDPEYNKGLTGLRQTLIDQPVGAAADFVTAPKRIMSGELTEGDPDFANSAIQGAAMLTGRGLAAPSEGIGIFGGIGAREAPMSNLSSALMKQQAGKTAGQIWQDTGWMKELGSDKMMFEIPDQNARMRPITNDMVDRPLTIKDVLSHPELERQYPDVMDSPIRMRTDLPPNILGGYNPDGSIEMNAFLPARQKRLTILHELNHLVSEKEGLSPGYNPNAPATRAFTQKLNESMAPAASSASSTAPSWNEAPSGPVTDFDVYKRMEGEDKSRIVSDRADMTDEQRQQVPPWESTDLPPGTPRYDARAVHDWYYGRGDIPQALTPQMSAGPLHDETVRSLTGGSPAGEDPTRGLADARTGDAGPVEKNALRRTRNMIQDLAGNKAAPGLSEAEALGRLKSQQGPLPSAAGMPAQPPVSPPFWDRPLQMSAAEPGKKTITGYHGSPADFNQFSDDFIGTGEGAQVKGHGHYIAGAEATAKSYRDKLSPGRGATPEDLAARTLYNFDGDRQKAISELQSRVDSLVGVPDKYVAKDSSLKPALELLKSEKHIGGRMYKVGINADPESFLDWDKSLNEQSPAVQKKLSPIIQQELQRRQAQRGGGPLADPENDLTHEGYLQTGNLSGGALYEGLGDKKAATETLKKVGIPGIRYLDQGSRSQGWGTHNHVVFDPKTIDIIKKYGVAGVGIGSIGMAAALANQNKNGFARGGAVKKRNKDEFDWNIPLNKQSESVQRLVRARLET